MNLARGGAEPDRVWRLLRRRAAAGRRAGTCRRPPVRTERARPRSTGSSSSARPSATGPPLTVGAGRLPDRYAGPARGGARDRPRARGRGLRLVLLSQGEPALDLHRFAAAGELVRVTEADLRDGRPTRSRRCCDSAARRAISHDRRRGRDSHARVGLRGPPRRGGAGGAARAWPMALDEPDRALEDYLAIEVLGELPAPVRNLRRVDQPRRGGAGRSWSDWCSAPARGRARPGHRRHRPHLAVADGSLTCHPLLRAAARALLPLERPETRGPTRRPIGARPVARRPRTSRRRRSSSAWRRGTGRRRRPSSSTSHAVPRLVSGTADDAVLRAAARPEVQAAEPLLNAAVAPGPAGPAGRRVAVLAATYRRAPGGARARWRAPSCSSGSPGSRAGHSQDAGSCRAHRQLLAEASVVDRGRPRRPRGMSRRVRRSRRAVDGAARPGDRRADPRRRPRRSRTPGGRHSTAPASSRCWRPTAVTWAWPTRRARSGAAGGRRRTAGSEWPTRSWPWPGCRRTAVSSRSARVRLDARQGRFAARPEPWLRRGGTTRRGAPADRLAAAPTRRSGSLRCGPAPGTGDRQTGSPSLVTVVSAEAILAAGEPQQALAAVTVGLPAGSPERSVLTAAARRDIGDVRGAAAAMASVGRRPPPGPASDAAPGLGPRGPAGRRPGSGRPGQRCSSNGCCGCASAEEFRRPLLADAEWLRWFLDRDGSALREHRPFVMSLPRPRRAVAARPGVRG